MQVTLDTTALREVLESVSRISTKHATLPILQCVLLTVTKGTLTLKATNLEIGIEGTLKAQTIEEGEIAVPAQILLQTVSLSTQKTITLTTKDQTLNITSGSSRSEIKSISADDFPQFPHLTSDPTIIHSELFSLGIKSTAFAASQSSIKPELGCIYIFQKKEHSLTFVATDSFRLMEKTIPHKNTILHESLLIPFKNALEFARVADLTQGEIELYINENQCALKTNNIYITSRLVSGNFPDYEQIIPKEYQVTATTLTQDVIVALRKTNIFLNKFMQLNIKLSDNSIILASQSGDYGSTTESIPAAIDGNEISLNFNQRYVQDVLSFITDESIILKCAGIGRPMVIENVHERSMRYLVMPMNK